MVPIFSNCRRIGFVNVLEGLGNGLAVEFKSEKICAE